jgi:hypothetical protein
VKAGDDAFDTQGDITLAGDILKWRPGPGILDENDGYSRLRDMIARMRSRLAGSTER